MFDLRLVIRSASFAAVAEAVQAVDPGEHFGYGGMLLSRNPATQRNDNLIPAIQLFA
jgi:hypothetical protein